MSDSLTWRDALEDINSAEPVDEEVEESKDTPEGSVGEESPAEDSPSEDPGETETDESEQDEVNEPAEPEEEAKESEESEEQPSEETEATAEDDDPDDPWIEIQGQKVRQSEVLEWRDSGMRTQDYTRKTMSLSEQRKALEAERKTMQTLATDIAKDATIQKFLSANPEAIQYLMADPTATRQLIGNPERVKQFWREYKVLKENPTIAERLYNRETPDQKPPEMVQAEMIQAAQAVGNSLNAAIEEVGKEFPGVDQVQIADYLFELAGLTEANLPKDPQLQQQAIFGALGRLQQMMFVSNGQQVFVDPRLIRDRFELLSKREQDNKTREDEKVEAHNARVDKALQQKKGPPASQGSAPLDQKEKPKPYASLQDALADIAR